ncbi:hypothetical protein BH09PSE6_BH09PSE6_21160 [soil metagenome]
MRLAVLIGSYGLWLIAMGRAIAFGSGFDLALWITVGAWGAVLLPAPAWLRLLQFALFGMAGLFLLATGLLSRWWDGPPHDGKAVVLCALLILAAEIGIMGRAFGSRDGDDDGT